MKLLILLTFIFLFPALTVSAQDNSGIPKAQQVDEFANINYSDIMARLDQVVIQLHNDPSSRMVVISYRSTVIPVGKTIRTFKFMKTYLTRNRGIDSSRLKFIDGGVTKEGFVFQIWNVPAGAEEPEILKPISNSINNSKTARKFDEDYYPFTDGDEYADGDSLTEYAAITKRESNSTAYVILYPTYYVYNDLDPDSASVIDSPGKINRVKADIMKRLRKVGIPLSKIKIVNGGYRDYRQVELWILPKGVEPPAATPNVFPETTRKSGKR